MSARAAWLCALALCSPGLASAGPWAKGQGKHYLKLTFQHLSSDRLAQPNGVVLDIPDFTKDDLWLYGELGISESVNVIIDVPLVRSSNLHDVPDELPRTTGFGDVRAGLQWQFARRGSWVFAARGLLQAPTGDETKGDGLLPTGSGAWEGVGSLGAGTSIRGGRGWAYLEAGYQYRAQGLRDGATYEAQFGWKIGDRLLLTANLRGVEPFSHEAPSTPIGSPAGLGDRVTYTSYGPSAIVKLGRGVSAQFDVEGAFNTRNIAKGPLFRIGVSYEN